MKTISLFVLFAVLAPAAAFAQQAPAAPAKPATAATAHKHECADCPMHKKGMKCAACPEKLKGVKTVSKNTENGVEITMTAADKGTAAKVQELASVHYAPGAKKCEGCPAAVPGAETSVQDIEGGVKVTVSGKTPDVVKKIQAASVKEHGAAAPARTAARAGKRYVCPMGDYEGDKPGKCPKCGMQLKEKK